MQTPEHRQPERRQTEVNTRSHCQQLLFLGFWLETRVKGDKIQGRTILSRRWVLLCWGAPPRDGSLTVWFLSSREKAKELWEWLHNLEAMKYDHCEQLKRQRYEVGELQIALTFPSGDASTLTASETRTRLSLLLSTQVRFPPASHVASSLPGDLSEKPHRWAAETVSKHKTEK